MLLYQCPVGIKSRKPDTPRSGGSFGENPRDRPRSGRGSRFGGTGEICPGLAHVDERIDRFRRRRKSRCRAPSQNSCAIGAERVETLALNSQVVGAAWLPLPQLALRVIRDLSAIWS